jgi:NitT/TauT family transport system ATP-binding protein
MRVEPQTINKISIEGITKWYNQPTGPIQALDNVSFKVDEGEFICLLGPSGCGKSTLLNLIGGLDAPDLGKILVDGTAVTGPDSDRMIMFQEPALFPWLNVFDNILFGLKLKPKLKAAERNEIAESFLKLVRLEKFKYSNIFELSGGMKQRASLARALAPNPHILLMDEPFTAIDAISREQIYTDVQEIWKTYNKTIIFVTHNVAEAICLGDRIILFSPSPGRNHEEFKINLPRPRDIRSIEVAKYVAEIVLLLRKYVPLEPFKE